MTKSREMLSQARREIRKRMGSKDRADKQITKKSAGIILQRKRRRKNVNLSGSSEATKDSAQTVNGSFSEA
jgi:hypothetical protein